MGFELRITSKNRSGSKISARKTAENSCTYGKYCRAVRNNGENTPEELSFYTFISSYTPC
jgi:hypothetical protein